MTMNNFNGKVLPLIHQAAVYKQWVKLEKLTPKAINAMERCLDSKNDAVRLQAAKDVLDRVYGKPTQRVESHATIDFGQLHLEALRALAAKPVLDMTASDSETIQSDTVSNGPIERGVSDVSDQTSDVNPFDE